MQNDKIKLATRKLNLHFGKKHVLKNINVGFGERKVTALIGPSGCGKSTLLRCFNRMHDRQTDVTIEGEIFLDEQDINSKQRSVTEIRRNVGMVFQRANPFPKTIYENITYGLKLNDVPHHQHKGIVEQTLSDVYLWEEVKDELSKPATRLSGGQQQRLCIARAVALRPEVILMDEPCSALDPLSTAKIEELILALKKDYTIVIVTHNLQQARRVADETVFMYLGEVVEKAKTEDLFASPQNELTRNYVGGVFG